MLHAVRPARARPFGAPLPCRKNRQRKLQGPIGAGSLVHYYHCCYCYCTTRASGNPMSSSSTVFTWPVHLSKTSSNVSMLTSRARCSSASSRCRTRPSICRGQTDSQSGKSFLAGGHTTSWAVRISSSVPPWASACPDSPTRPRRRYACEHRTVRQ